jgi:hypothetical protein
MPTIRGMMEGSVDHAFLSQPFGETTMGIIRPFVRRLLPSVSACLLMTALIVGCSEDNALFCATDDDCKSAIEQGQIPQDAERCHPEAHICYPGCQTDQDCASVPGLIPDLVCDHREGHCRKTAPRDMGLKDMGPDFDFGPKPRPLGAPCSSPSQCQSGKCTDGACCTVDSCGKCKRCNVNGNGTCENAGDGQNLGGDCGSGSCAGTCQSGSCNFAAVPATKRCRATCSGDNLVEYFCSGTGTCTTAGRVTERCNPFTCESIDGVKDRCYDACGVTSAECTSKSVCDRSRAHERGGACAGEPVVVVTPSTVATALANCPRRRGAGYTRPHTGKL